MILCIRSSPFLSLDLCVFPSFFSLLFYNIDLICYCGGKKKVTPLLLLLTMVGFEDHREDYLKNYLYFGLLTDQVLPTLLVVENLCNISTTYAVLLSLKWRSIFFSFILRTFKAAKK